MKKVIKVLVEDRNNPEQKDIFLSVEVEEEAIEKAKKLINFDFNPDGNTMVTILKGLGVVFTATTEQNRKDLEGNERCGEAQRRISIAQTKIETATMFAVKSNFSC